MPNNKKTLNKTECRVCNKCGKEIPKLKKLPRNEGIFCNECVIENLDYGKWSLSDEREFFENLFFGRFNSFLLVFSLFVTAGFANSFQQFRYLVFYFGAFLLFLCWLTLLRALVKFELVIQLLFNKEGHILYILQKIAKNGGYKPRFDNSKLMGVYIPILCITFLIAMGVLINIGYLK